LIEEAYNQEPNVIQHIFTAAYNNDSRQRGWTFNFTQEWPVFSQDHQFSYSVPTYHFIDGADRIYGLGDPPQFQKFVCGKKLYNYDSLEPSERKLVL